MDFNHKTICKPYMETGYCGYGDTCKYLHIRKIENTECPICKEAYTNKVFASCGHSFCLDCISEYYIKTESCPLCNVVISGGFIMN